MTQPNCSSNSLYPIPSAPLLAPSETHPSPNLSPEQGIFNTVVLLFRTLIGNYLFNFCDQYFYFFFLYMF